MILCPFFHLTFISIFHIIKSYLSIFHSLMYHSLLSHSLPSDAHLHWVQFLTIKNNILQLMIMLW